MTLRIIASSYYKGGVQITKRVTSIYFSTISLPLEGRNMFQKPDNVNHPLNCVCPVLRFHRLTVTGFLANMSPYRVTSISFVSFMGYLTLYILISVSIFSILFSTHFQRGWQGEFVSQSRAALVGDHLFYSHDCRVWFRADIVRRN